MHSCHDFRSFLLRDVELQLPAIELLVKSLSNICICFNKVMPSRILIEDATTVAASKCPILPVDKYGRYCYAMIN